MSDSRTGDAAGDASPEALLRELDPFLNVFALANGLDLLKEGEDGPVRLLGWYREGMERFLRIEPSGQTSDRFIVWAEAHQRRDGRTRRGRRPVQGELAGEVLRRELRGLLERGIEDANDLGSSDLDPA